MELYWRRGALLASWSSTGFVEPDLNFTCLFDTKRFLTLRILLASWSSDTRENPGPIVENLGSWLLLASWSSTGFVEPDLNFYWLRGARFEFLLASWSSDENPEKSWADLADPHRGLNQRLSLTILRSKCQRSKLQRRRGLP